MVFTLFTILWFYQPEGWFILEKEGATEKGCGKIGGKCVLEFQENFMLNLSVFLLLFFGL